MAEDLIFYEINIFHFNLDIDYFLVSIVYL
jgi:hypothetical protein